jgi:hypothetical protein
MIYPTDGLQLGDGKVFNWNSSEDGKRDWSRFYPRLKMLLGDKSWVTSEREIESQSAGEPPQPPPRGRGGAVPDYEAVEKHRERYGRWKLTVQKIDQAFFFAIATLRGLFESGCMASHQIEQALIIPVGVDDDDWPPARQFKAAMDMLKETYSASTDADVASLRLELEQLSDQVPGGFTEYHRNFVRVLTQLRATKADAVSDSELTTWVKRAIKNDMVNNSLLLRLYVDKKNITYDKILAKVTQLLVELSNQDKDPYKTASGSKGSVGANVVESRGQKTVGPREYRTSANNKRFGGCTLCWGEGHWWKDCPNDECQACGAVLRRQDKTCPHWREHEPRLRFEGDIEPWNRGREGPSDESGPDTSGDRDGSTSQASAPSSQDATKANRAARGGKRGRWN